MTRARVVCTEQGNRNLRRNLLPISLCDPGEMDYIQTMMQKDADNIYNLFYSLGGI